MTPEQLWQEFVEKYPSYKGKSYDAFTFGDKPDELLQLVLCGKKTATSCVYKGGKTSQVGDISIILDSAGNARAIIEDTKVSVVPFSKVDADFACKEGEGDKTLVTWRKIHEAFWKDIKPDTLLECEAFKLLYQDIELDIHENQNNG
ncbi:MAG: ASCH domain-containing protein [Alphaproteobacteria bacterium]|nr:ASCH domain-containing protein [Alphaproteobacteria bacterium]